VVQRDCRQQLIVGTFPETPEDKQHLMTFIGVLLKGFLPLVVKLLECFSNCTFQTLVGCNSGHSCESGQWSDHDFGFGLQQQLVLLKSVWLILGLMLPIVGVLV